MAKKIYVSPSSQTNNVYAVGNTNEAVQCRKIAAAVVTALKRCGFDAKTNTEDGKTMYDRVRESNAWGADAHIPIHSNAYDGKVAGFRGFYLSKASEGYKLVAAIEKALAPITPGTSDGLSAQPKLYEVKASNAPCAYLEVGFHDSPVEAQYIIDHTEEIGEAICVGICKHYGIAYVAPNDAEPPKEEPEKTVTVVIEKGSVVTLDVDAVYYNGKVIPAWVKAEKWIVKSVSGDRVVIDKSVNGKYSICSPVKAEYLNVVDTSSEENTVYPLYPNEKPDYARSGPDKDKAGLYKVVANGGLYLRAGASKSKRAIELMKNGSHVRCYGYYTGEWMYVVSDSGKKGFCHSSYLKRI